MSEGEHSHPDYLKIYKILMVLFVVSVLGAEVGIKWVMVITAFGIAIVKALMVAAYFMHLNIEKKYIWYLMILGLTFLALFFVAVAPDVMKTEGQNWVDTTILEHALPSGDHHGSANAHHD